MLFSATTRILRGASALDYILTEFRGRRYLKNLFEETYIKDVLERKHFTNVDNLNDVLNILASSVGSLTNVQNIQNIYRGSRKSKN